MYGSASSPDAFAAGVSLTANDRFGNETLAIARSTLACARTTGGCGGLASSASVVPDPAASVTVVPAFVTLTSPSGTRTAWAPSSGPPTERGEEDREADLRTCAFLHTSADEQERAAQHRERKPVARLPRCIDEAADHPRRVLAQRQAHVVGQSGAKTRVRPGAERSAEDPRVGDRERTNRTAGPGGHRVLHPVGAAQTRPESDRANVAERQSSAGRITELPSLRAGRRATLCGMIAAWGEAIASVSGCQNR